MSEDEDKRAYAGPGRESTRRQDMPDDHRDVKEYVEAVDDDVPEEDLQKRVADTLGDEAEHSKD
jgi:hypothetical protein